MRVKDSDLMRDDGRNGEHCRDAPPEDVRQGRQSLQRHRRHLRRPRRWRDDPSDHHGGEPVGQRPAEEVEQQEGDGASSTPMALL